MKINYFTGYVFTISYCNFFHYFRVYFCLLRKGLLEKDNGMLCLQLSALFRLLSVTGHSYRNLMQWRYEFLPQRQQSRPNSKVWPLYPVPAFEGTEDVFSRLMTVCCILLPYNPWVIPCQVQQWKYPTISDFIHTWTWSTTGGMKNSKFS
jgi:hypothetical protein